METTKTIHAPVRPQPLLVGEDEAENLRSESLGLISVTLSRRQICDVELIMNGGFTPLDGFMDRASYESVLESLRLPNGVLWPIPVTLDIDRSLAQKLEPGTRLALCDQEGLMLAVLDVSVIWEVDKRAEAERVFGTTSEHHPGVRYLHEQVEDIYVGGRISGIQLPTHYDYQELRSSPQELSQHFERLGWKKIIGFHTNHLMHKRERELTFIAAKETQAHLLLHPVVGITLSRSTSYFARVKGYQEILRHYPHSLATLSLLPLAIRNAGPREALWHAIIRRNYGCTEFIVEHDHASPSQSLSSVSDPFYPSYAAQELVQDHEAELGISIYPASRFGYSPTANRYIPIGRNGMVKGEAIELSDTDIIEQIVRSEEIPDWFTYPAVLDTLRTTYPPRCKQGLTLFFTGLSGSGKSTLAKILYGRFAEEGKRPVTLLDGDIVRYHLSKELGFSKLDRDLNVRRIGFVASEITKNGGIAICAPIAPYANTRRVVREMVETYGAMIEIHICTSIEVCETRDRKGLYAKARKGLIPEFTGVSDPYEEPENPELRIDTAHLTPVQAAQDIFLYLFSQGYLDPMD